MARGIGLTFWDAQLCSDYLTATGIIVTNGACCHMLEEMKNSF